MLNFIPSSKIDGVYIIERKSHLDTRGGFERMFCSKTLKQHGLSYDFPQVNLSTNNTKLTLRGMHFQIPPFEETKIVSCIKGSIYDVVVDLRDKSNIKWEGFYLNEGDNKSIYIPKGLAHGYLTLEDNSSILYFVDQEYVPTAENGVCWDDISVAINWPFHPLLLSDKDKKWKPLF